MNAPGGGTGNASLDSILVGSNSGGTLNVNVNGGSILYNGAATLDNFQRGIAGAGGAAPAQVLQAHDYIFTATGAGSIGTDLEPIQSTNFGADGSSGGSNFTLNAGDGGVYLTDWGAIDATLASVSATGPGNVRVVAGNAGTHNMFVSGNVSAVAGNIYLASDDNLSVGSGVVIGGPNFSGTVWMQANRDQANGSTTSGQFFNFDSSSLIETSNTTNVVTTVRDPSTQAVYLDIAGDVANASNLSVGNITVGDGGRIVINAIPDGLSSESGQILNAGNAILNAGARERHHRSHRRVHQHHHRRNRCERRFVRPPGCRRRNGPRDRQLRQRLHQRQRLDHLQRPGHRVGPRANRRDQHQPRRHLRHALDRGNRRHGSLRRHQLDGAGRSRGRGTSLRRRRRDNQRDG